MFVNRVLKKAGQGLGTFATLLMVMSGGASVVAPAAASTTTATIAQVVLIKDGKLVFVYPTGGIHDPATCAAGGGGSYYSFSYSGAAASTYLATLLAARASGATVTFYGSNSCTAQSNVSETLSTFSVN
jgi:hypothetical protein